MNKTLFFLLFLTVLSFSAAAEADPAILVRGPVPHEGIEYLGVNAIPSEYAEYRYGSDLISVYFTQQDIFLSSEWGDLDCNSDSFKSIETAGGRLVVSYTDRKGWTAFISFPSSAGYICDFLDRYVSRQNYFINIARDRTSFSFPAIIEVD